DLDTQTGCPDIDQLHAPARGKNDLAFRAGDDAAVLYIGSDQIHLTAVRRRNGTLIDHTARTRRLGKAQTTLHKTAVRQVERRNHKSRNIDLCTSAEQHSVGVDQEYATVGLQRPKNERGVNADNTIQYRACCRLLDELR